jgi:hypothetical protein
MKGALALLLAAASVVWAAYWMEDLHRQGIAPHSSAHSYQVFRNVKIAGAIGDGGMSAYF